jgi:hypothetical protein
VIGGCCHVILLANQRWSPRSPILPTLSENMGSTPIFAGVSVVVHPIFWGFFCRSLFIFLFFFPFHHCVGCPSIYHFFIPLWYLQTFFPMYFSINEWEFSSILNKIGMKSSWNNVSVKVWCASMKVWYF